MKDIDFDELDRAVSSVLGQKTVDTGVKPADANEKDQSGPSENSVSETTSSEISTSSTPETPVVNTKPAATPLAIKRRGKFMDVMHPSADMNAKPTGAPAKAPRPKPVITPLLTEEVESTVEHTSEPTASLDESHTLIGAEPAQMSDTLPEQADTSEPSVHSSENTDKTEEISPDMAVTSEPEAQEPTPAEDSQLLEASESEELAEEPVAGTQPESASPQVTPFLSDTQVEKRPLGAFGDAETVPGTSSESTDSDASEADKPVDMQAAPVVSLPRELQPDVVGVESVQATETLEAPVTGTSPFAAKVAVAPEASDGRVEGHPLFDTSTYHEPIAAVHHTGLPGWAKWLIGLLACLAIGAGVGYFLFTAGL